jgi:oligosaccharide repeat unit polymerase
MSTFAHSFPVPARWQLAAPAAAFEVLGYLCVVGVGTLCFLFGWLTPNGAGVLTVLLLSSLIVLAWKRFDQGRHPCFLFLCVLLFFQGGRLIAYCLGGLTDPLRVELMTLAPFDVTRNEAGSVLLLLALSAICVYAPCRWNYRPFALLDDIRARRYLPYLYVVFFAALPIQLFKNYRYYQYVQDHGGYAVIFMHHSNLAASVPFFVRAISLISFPALVAIFVLEKRKRFLYTVAALYFAAGSLILLLGSRGFIFGLVLALWYVSKAKSARRTRIMLAAVVVLALMLVADVIQNVREDSDEISTYTFLPIAFVASQGTSLNVTEVAVKYREVFAPYAVSYLLHELENAFVARDTSNYFRGKTLPSDIPVLLDPAAYSQGHGTGSSYLAEAYVIGGLTGVVVISLLIGAGLHLMHHFSGRAFSLFVVAMIIPDVLMMPRGNLLDWLSVFSRNVLSIVLLALGWGLYSMLTSIKHVPAEVQGAGANT